MGWNVALDWDNPSLDEIGLYFADIFNAVNERCDAWSYSLSLYGFRPFRVGTRYGVVSNTLGAITSITLSGSFPATISKTGTLTLKDDGVDMQQFDEVKYTDVSGSGGTRTFTVDATLAYDYYSEWAFIHDLNPDHLSLYNIGTFVTSIDSKIDQFLTKYADHTQATAGKFVNFDDIPLWTESSILTAIGDASRVRGVFCDIAEWIKQVYKILNQLKWLRYFSSPGRNEDFGSFGSGWYVRSGNDLSWAGAQADYNGNPWFFYGGLSDPIQAHGVNDERYLPAIEDYEVRVARTPHDVSVISNRFSHQADFYGYIVTPSVTVPPVTGGVVEFNGEGLYTENKYNRVLSQASGGTSRTIFTFEDLFNTSPNTEPSDPVLPDDWIASGWSMEGQFGGTKNRYLIMKFDGVGGFDYI